MEELRRSKVHRNLDSRLKILGMEAQDLIFVTLFASIMNLIFGKTALGIYMTFGVPLVMGIILFISKRNKPDDFLIHFIRFYISAGVYSAASKSDYLVKVKKRRSK